MAKASNLPGYEFLEPIGAGAESVIYRARALTNGEIVAVKDIQVDHRDKHKYLRHAENEYRVLRDLHARSNGQGMPGIVRVHRLMRSGWLRRNKRYSIVMEFLEGQDLRRERRYPFGQLIDIFYQVSGALSRLHAAGIVHGDLKPENIIVSPTGEATLVDFGFSCRAGSLAASIRGTRDYMAPEQVDMGRITEQTDIYNFGATMYFILTETHVPALIPAQGDKSLFIASRYADPKSPRALNPNVPPELSSLILRCVRKEPIERPRCVEEVRSILEQARSAFVGP